MLLKQLLLLSCSILLPLCALAQDEQADKGRLLIDINACLLSYKGDLQDNYSKLGGGFALGIQANSKKNVNMKLNFSQGQVSGQNPYWRIEDFEQNMPNTFFQTKFFCAELGLQIALIKKERFRFVFSQGIGMMRFTPYDAQGEKLEFQNRTRAQGELANSSALVLPTAISFQYIFTNNMRFSWQIGYFNTQTDYIDNVSELVNPTKKDNIFRNNFSLSIPIQVGSKN